MYIIVRGRDVGDKNVKINGIKINLIEIEAELGIFIYKIHTYIYIYFNLNFI